MNAGMNTASLRRNITILGTYKQWSGLQFTLLHHLCNIKNSESINMKDTIKGEERADFRRRYWHATKSRNTEGTVFSPAGCLVRERRVLEGLGC